MNDLYLEYREDASDVFGYDEYSEEENGYEYGQGVTIEFDPIKVTIEPRSTACYEELEHEFTELPDTVYAVIVRYDNFEFSRYQDWHVVGVFVSSEEAEESSEHINSGLSEGIWNSGRNELAWVDVCELTVEK